MKINKYSKPIFAGIALIAFLHYTLMGIKVLGRQQSIFYLDEEITIGAAYTTIIAFMAGFFFLVYSSKDNFIRTTESLTSFAAGIFFILLSFDEYLSLHEYLNQIVKDNSGDDSLLHEIAEFSWMAPLLILIAIIFYFLLVQIKKEDNTTAKKSFTLGLFCFIFVLVLELAGGRLYGNGIYATIVGIEESLEMLGIAFYINGILEKLDLGKLLK